MTPGETREPFKVGDRVRILNTGLRPGRIVEFRGPLGPGGSLIYRVRFRRKPPGYVEVREDQLEHLPAKDASAPASEEAS